MPIKSPAESYQFSRLCFRADVIERLDDHQAFRVVTPVGTFQMTKSEFVQVFRHVISTESWRRGRRIYHYRKVPQKAEKFLI